MNDIGSLSDHFLVHERVRPIAMSKSIPFLPPISNKFKSYFYHRHRSIRMLKSLLTREMRLSAEMSSGPTVVPHTNMPATFGVQTMT